MSDGSWLSEAKIFSLALLEIAGSPANLLIPSLTHRSHSSSVRQVTHMDKCFSSIFFSRGESSASSRELIFSRFCSHDIALFFMPNIFPQFAGQDGSRPKQPRSHCSDRARNYFRHLGVGESADINEYNRGGRFLRQAVQRDR